MEQMEERPLKKVKLCFMGNLLDGYAIYNMKPDKQGLIHAVHIESGKQIRVNRQRIFDKDTDTVNLKIKKRKPIKKLQNVGSNIADMNHLNSISELWIRDDVEFDGQTDVVTLCMVFEDIGRYITFNTYNGTFGKKGKVPPYKDILNGGKKGYPIKDIDKLRSKLEKKGYDRYSP